jgi:iron complex transport system substrate-binding protein
MPCGFDLDRTQKDLEQLAQHPQWATLKAVQNGQVYITDGNHYFNRPGTRLVDSLEILAEILYPDRFQYGYQERGWKKYY